MKKENIKINCPVCNVLLNIKNLDTHLSLVHGVYIPNLDKYTSQYNLSADRKLEIYREIEHIKELINNNIEQDRLKELQNNFKELKAMLMPRMPLDKLLKYEIAKTHIEINNNVLKKNTNKISSYQNEIAKFSRIVGGVLRTENIEKQTLPMVGTDEFYETFMELIPNMVESFLIKKEKEKIGIEKSIKFDRNYEKGYPNIENITIEEMTKRTNYRRDMKKISSITGGILREENSKRETPTIVGTDEFLKMFTKLVPKIIDSFMNKKKEKEKKKILEDISYKESINFCQFEYDGQLDSEEIKTQPSNEKIMENNEIKTLDQKTYWEETSPIKEPAIIQNVLKHQADSFQYRDDEGLDSNMIIDEEQYQEEFINNLSKNKINIVKTQRVVFQKSIVDKEEKDLKNDIKIFLSKMYKGYCQVCGFTFKKLNGENSFEMFNWNDKRVVKIKKSFISTADSLCLCRNCSANIKWGAFTPVFIDKISNIEDFQLKKPDEIKKLLHNIVESNIPDIFKDLIDFDDMYALEIELRGEPRNIYFTNEHLLQFIAYLQTEEEFEEEILFKKEKDRKRQISNRIYSSNTWLKREETVPESLARDFVRSSAWWLSHPSGPVRARGHASNVYKNDIHGWAVDFGANKFLVGKAIERCKNEINNYIEETNHDNNMDLNALKEKLRKHISGAVATYNNGEYSGYYPLYGDHMEFGSQSISVNDGVQFLLSKLGISKGF